MRFEREALKSLAWGFVLAFAVATATAADKAVDTVPLAIDLAADARDARTTQRVIVTLFGTTDCPWCKRVRREYLLPMMKNPDDRARVIFREVDIESPARLVDFQGRGSTHREFASRLGVRFTPVIAFYGPDGAPVAEKIVGFSGDFFGAYLEDKINEGHAKLRSLTP